MIAWSAPIAQSHFSKMRLRYSAQKCVGVLQPSKSTSHPQTMICPCPCDVPCSLSFLPSADLMDKVTVPARISFDTQLAVIFQGPLVSRPPGVRVHRGRCPVDGRKEKKITQSFLNDRSLNFLHSGSKGHSDCIWRRSTRTSGCRQFLEWG